MTPEVAEERTHALLQTDLAIQPDVEHIETLDANESPSGHPETTLLVELSNSRRGVPAWLLGKLQNYGLDLAPDIEVEADRARLVVR